MKSMKPDTVFTLLAVIALLAGYIGLGYGLAHDDDARVFFGMYLIALGVLSLFSIGDVE